MEQLLKAEELSKAEEMTMTKTSPLMDELPIRKELPGVEGSLKAEELQKAENFAKTEENVETLVGGTHPTVKLLHTPQPTSEDVHKLFGPYQRISPPWTIYERVKTTLVAVFVLPFRLVYLVLAGILLLLIARIALIGLPPTRPEDSVPSASDKTADDYDEDPLFKPYAKWRRSILLLSFPIARSILFLSFGIYRVNRLSAPFSTPVTERMQKEDNPHAYVIVANHLGYIDILVLLTTFKGSFVAKGDFEKTPLIGYFARALQCMFVRQGQSLTTQLVSRVQSTYKCHQLRSHKCGNCSSCMTPLVIFPEGTTTNGFSMVPFRTGVFNAGIPVRPVCIRFPYRHFNLSWETIRFREHIFRTMTQVRNNVEFIEMPVYVPSDEEKSDSRLFASNVQNEMGRVLEQGVTPLNRKHKFLYHSYLLGKEKKETEIFLKAKQLLQNDEQITYFLTAHGQDIV